MIVEVKIPEVGESVTEGLLAEWSAADGSVVTADEPLLVLETDKITMNVSSEHGGRLQVLVEAGETVEVGQVVAKIDTDATPDPAAEIASAEAETDTTEATAEDTAPPAQPLAQPAGMPQAKATLADLRGLSPAVQRMVVEHRLDPDAITGTGKDGRIIKNDVLRYIEDHGGVKDEKTPSPPPPASSSTGPTPVHEQRQTRTAMSPLRQRIAERLVQVQQNAAILTTFNEADMTRVMELRKNYKPEFKEKYNVDLGFMSFFVKACINALETYPEVNSFIDGEDVVTNHYYDIGVAVSTDKGLVVPVVRSADRLSMAQIEREIANLATRARERRLELSDLTGAVFTISNGGVFGSLLSTPILNPPGSALLGMHTIQKRPVVIDDEIVIRPMMYLAMSYDHRIVDGREAVTFLRRIKECIENPERMLLEV